MNKKYPVLKCDVKLWKEVKPVLESFGITDFDKADYFDKDYSYLVCNYEDDAVDEFKIGTTCYGEISEITDYRYLVNTKEEFLSAVAKLLGKEYPITSKNKKDMEKINIAEKLKHCKKGTKLYSSVYGEVEFIKVEYSVIYIKVLDITNETFSRSFNKNGMYDDFPDGECLLFPSKDNRDWNTFQLLEEGHRVMVSSNGIDWYLHMYSSDNNSKYFSSDDDTEWLYIVPVEEFDFNAEDITINIKKSIV